MKLTTKIYALAALVLLQAGCASLPKQADMPDTIKFYSGSDLASDEVAVLYIPSPLNNIKQTGDPDMPVIFSFHWNLKLALKPGTYTRTFLFNWSQPAQQHKSGCQIILGPSSPVTFTLEAGRKYTVLYTLKSESMDQSIGVNCDELMQIRQRKDTNGVMQLTINNQPLFFTPLIVDTTDDKELAHLIETNGDWLLRWFALDFIKNSDCVDLDNLSKNDPNVNVRNRAYERLMKRGRYY